MVIETREGAVGPKDQLHSQITESTIKHIVSLLTEQKKGEFFHGAASRVMAQEDAAFANFVTAESRHYKNPSQAYFFTLGAEVGWSAYYLEAKTRSQSLPSTSPSLLEELRRQTQTGELEETLKPLMADGESEVAALYFRALGATGLLYNSSFVARIITNKVNSRYELKNANVEAFYEGFSLGVGLNQIRQGVPDKSFAFSGRP